LSYILILYHNFIIDYQFLFEVYFSEIYFIYFLQLSYYDVNLDFYIFFFNQLKIYQLNLVNSIFNKTTQLDLYILFILSL